MCGHPEDREDVSNFLEIGKVYTVHHTSVGGSHTKVYLEEIRSHSFNSVNFVDVEEPNVRVELEGCDDSTVVEIKATSEQIEFLNKLSIQINKTSTYSCMPKLHINIIEE